MLFLNTTLANHMNYFSKSKKISIRNRRYNRFDRFLTK